MQRVSGLRKTAELSDSVRQHLNMYAIAAGAAGMGILALSQSAEAKVIYTPAHTKIGLHQRSFIDIDHDGTIDFTIEHRFVSYSACSLRDTLDELPAAGNGVKDRPPRALYQGALIGRSQPFYGRAGVMAFVSLYRGSGMCRVGVGGDWRHATNRYLGLKFQIRGALHFGWARLTVHVGLPMSVILTGYAYETIPGKAIIAGATKGPDDAEPTASVNAPTPKPATLGVLALGAPALSIWRRKELAVAAPQENQS